MTPALTTQSLIGTSLVLNIGNTGTWLNCQNVLNIEIACNGSSFSGLVSDTYTSLPQAFTSSPYSYNTQTINIANFCPGTVYKFRIREANWPSGSQSSWSSIYTFTTAGVYIPPTLSLSAFPNLICPPAPVQLSATVNNSCGQSNYSYAWFPATGLNNAFISNPIATVTAPITYTCIVSGGATGCWALVGSIFLNVGTGPPVPGIVSANPNSLCVYNSVTLSTTTYTGNVQWQSSGSVSGPWTNIPGATLQSYVIPSLANTTCFQAQFTSCSGATGTSNISCAITHSVPVLTPSVGCTGSLSLLSFSHLGSSGTPSNVVWAPAPLSLTSGSTAASYSTAGTVYALAQFTDGCISSTSFAVVSPSLNVVVSPVTCSAVASATVFPSNITGPMTFTWLPTSQTTSVATGLFPGNFSVTVGFNNGNCSASTTTSLVSLSVVTGTVLHTDTINCYGIPTGTASMLLAGGSGSSSYVWTDGFNNQTGALATGLSAGNYTVTVTDMLTFCVMSRTFQVNQPPAATLTIVPASPTACVGGNIGLTGINSGGTPGYTYTWTAGPIAVTHTVSETTSGLHSYTLSSRDAHQCLAVKTITLNFITNPTVSASNVTICPGSTGTLTASGASSYTWNGGPATGSSFTASPGISSFYSVLGSAFGCTATASVFMIMNPAPIPGFTSNSPICNGQNLLLYGSGGVSYSWAGPSSFLAGGSTAFISSASPGYSGNYTLTVTSAIGCTAGISASLTVNATPPLSASGSTVCSNGTLLLNASSSPGIGFVWTGPLSFTSTLQNPAITSPSTSRSGFYTVTATSAPGCTNTTTAHVAVTQLPSPLAGSNGPQCTGASINFTASGGTTYWWSGPNGFTSFIQNPVLPSASMAANGTYTIMATTGPCNAWAYHYLTIHPLPTPVATNNSPVCESKALRLFAATGSSVSTYNWYGPSFYSVIANPVRDSSKVAYTGTYTLTVTDFKGCQSTATTDATVLPKPNLSVNGATVCLNQPAILLVNGANLYLWKGPNNYQSSQASSLINKVNSASVGFYTVTGTAVNSCSSSAVAHVSTLSLPSPSVVVFPATKICLNAAVRMEGYGGLNYKWYGPENIYYEGQVFNFSATNQHASGTYTLVAIDGKSCANATTTTLEIFPLPEGTLLGDKMEGCAPLCSDYRFAPITTSSVISGSWVINNKHLPSSFSHCFYEVGTHTVEGTFYDSLTGCKNSVNFQISVHPVPIADFNYSPLKPVENVDDVIFTNSSSGEDLNGFNWTLTSDSPGAPANLSSSKHTTYHFSESGYYPVAMIVSNTWGCADTLMKTVHVEEDFNLFVPNAFTPNEDKHNELFIPVTRGVKLYKLMIFDRWGAVVFHTDNLTEGWDGTYQGEPCQSGVFTWRMSATSIHGENKELSGHVTLYR
ncbi:MAG: gliding motility-associated C-terminal domain-containing protein [bacterium]|nr:gliding motility-associated C-terminal domain-containing protein [bacterium]